MNAINDESLWVFGIVYFNVPSGDESGEVLKTRLLSLWQGMTNGFRKSRFLLATVAFK